MFLSECGWWVEWDMWKERKGEPPSSSQHIFGRGCLMSAYEVTCRSMMTKDINAVRSRLGLDSVMFSWDTAEEDIFMAWYGHRRFAVARVRSSRRVLGRRRL